MRRGAQAVIVASLTCAAPTLAHAHAFGAAYVLPVPFWMYAYGCAATLLVTFAVLAYFLRDAGGPAPVAEARALRLPRSLLMLLRLAAAACLILTIISGYLGAQDADRNIAMTMFWVCFLLGFAYLSVLAGNLYRLIDPWRTAVGLLERCGFDLSSPRVRYPAWLGSWPAFLVYVGLICLELFSSGTPAVLARALTVYSLVALAAVVAFGKDVYFSKIDVFGAYFRTIGKLAPVAYSPLEGEGWGARLRRPLLGALDDPPADAGMVLFVLFMLASTAYDGIHDTQLWTGLYWKSSLSALLPLWGGDLGRAQDGLMLGFLAYRGLGLLVFPFLYLAIYVATLGVARLLTRAALRPRAAMYIFCNSLIPIGVGYSIAHYFAFFVAQVASAPDLLSDPLGLGWNLLGLGAPRTGAPLPMGIIWHVEVGAILIGHVVGVCLAHMAAVRTQGDAGGAVLGQLSLLALMVGYTIFGLWILSLPLA